MGTLQTIVTDRLSLAASLPMRLLVIASANDDLVAHDVRRWAECLQREDLQSMPMWSAFARLLVGFPEFRTLTHHRIRRLPKPLRVIARLAWRGEPTLRLACDSIGGGLFIQHGFSTIVAAKSIGEDCWINQQTTIGFRGLHSPVIGNRVRIGAAAVVVGGIVLGDDVRVGVNATVIRSVPAGATVVAPAAVTLTSAQELRGLPDQELTPNANLPVRRPPEAMAARKRRTERPGPSDA